MRKPTGSSGQDDFTQKCQTLHRQLFAMEEGDTFGDSSGDEEEEVIPPEPQSSDDSSVGKESEDDEDFNLNSQPSQPSQSSQPIPAAIPTVNHRVITSSSDSGGVRVRTDTKSKNAKPKPTTRLHVGKLYIVFCSNCHK